MSRLIFPGEPPALVFISSVMRPELDWARSTAVSALSGVPYLSAWAFEYTPASSAPADDTYLSKVAAADLVLWLAGAETTTPVQSEIAEAIAADRRIIAIKLPASERDRATQTLISEVQDRCKWAEARDEQELREVLAMTVSDEIVRALRGHPTLTRRARLEEIGRASRARCIARWEGVGLEPSDAIALADDVSVGAPPDEVMPSDESPHLLVVGEVGTGKSLVAERIHQGAIADAHSRVAAPVPVYLAAFEVGPSLEQTILAKANRLGDVHRYGVALVIDGIDEVDELSASRILEQSRVCVRTWPASSAVVTSRDLPFLDVQPQTHRLPALAEDEVLALVGRVAGRKIHPAAIYNWPEPVRDAAGRPLFAILLGLSLRADDTAPASPGLLIARLVAHLLRETTAQSLAALKALAIRATESGGAPIRLADLGGPGVMHTPSLRRLIVVSGEFASFPLPLLTQWFAAQALVDSDVTTADLMAEPERLDRWRYPLAVVVATAGESLVDSLLSELTRIHPGLSARVIEDGSREFYAGQAEPTPTSLEAGRRLRAAYESWDAGLAPVSEYVLPRSDDGRLLPVAVHAHADSLMDGWYEGTALAGDVHVFPGDINFFQPPRDWHPTHLGHTNWEPVWPWARSLDYVKSQLPAVLGRGALPVKSDHLVDEALFLFACVVSQESPVLDPQPPLDPVISELEGIPQPWIQTKWSAFDRLAALERARTLRRAGPTISSPWPGMDRPFGGGWIWSPYSPQRQLERVTAVYEALLPAYAALCDEWFPRAKSRLVTYVTLPAVFTGVYQAAGDRTEWPTLKWYLDPLPSGAESRVDIKLSTGPDDALPEAGSLYQRVLDRRPSAAAWITVYSHNGVAADIFDPNPLRQFLFSWLQDDLKRASLVR